MTKENHENQQYGVICKDSNRIQFVWRFSKLVAFYLYEKIKKNRTFVIAISLCLIFFLISFCGYSFQLMYQQASSFLKSFVFCANKPMHEDKCWYEFAIKIISLTGCIALVNKFTSEIDRTVYNFQRQHNFKDLSTLTLLLLNSSFTIGFEGNCYRVEVSPVYDFAWELRCFTVSKYPSILQHIIYVLKN